MEGTYSRAGVMTALYVTMVSVFFLAHPVSVSDSIICSGLYACTEMLGISVLYVSFGSKVKPITFWGVASVVYFDIQIALIF